MWVSKDPTSKPSGLTSQSHSLKRIFILGLPVQRFHGNLMCCKGFIIYNVLVDTDNATDDIFVKAFKQMHEPDDKIQDSTFPLCGFGGQEVMALVKLALPITFDYVNNTRIEEFLFEIVDIEFSYNAIIRRGTLNIFEAVLHSAYLCMKIPSNQ
jgi:hypothetical protein